MSFGSSASSCNPSLAWFMGNSGKGRLLIEFPFSLTSGWYSEQSCTKFRSLEHRKERTGLRHEYILLRLIDGSVCRIERMGDPNAPFDSITEQGSIAYDMIQSFRPEEIDQACLKTSDIVVEIKLPRLLDLIDVLTICRAIHEVAKTRNYTLRVFNCYFFSLAILACLTRLISDWGDVHFLKKWLSVVKHGIEMLAVSYQQPATRTSTSPNKPLVFRLHSILTPRKSYHGCTKSLLEKIKLKLQRRITDPYSSTMEELEYCVHRSLWYSTIGSGLKQFLEKEIYHITKEIIKESAAAVPLGSRARRDDPVTAKKARDQLISTFERMFALHTSSPTIGIRAPRISNTTASARTGGVKPKSARLRKCRSNPKHPETVARELSFRGTQAVTLQTTPGLTMDWYQCVVVGVSCLWLWLLEVLGIRTAKVDAGLCAPTDEGWKKALADLEKLNSVTLTDFERFVKETNVLIENKAAMWKKAPWTELCDRISQCISEEIVKEVEKNKPRITVWSKEQPRFKVTKISKFQCGIHNRIRAHAKVVENVWFGSAASIETELEDTISQIWKLIRKAGAVSEMAPQAIVHEALSSVNYGSETLASKATTSKDNESLRSTALYHENVTLQQFDDESSSDSGQSNTLVPFYHWNNIQLVANRLHRSPLTTTKSHISPRRGALLRSLYLPLVNYILSPNPGDSPTFEQGPNSPTPVGKAILPNSGTGCSNNNCERAPLATNLPSESPPSIPGFVLTGEQASVLPVRYIGSNAERSYVPTIASVPSDTKAEAVTSLDPNIQKLSGARSKGPHSLPPSPLYPISTTNLKKKNRPSTSRAHLPPVNERQMSMDTPSDVTPITCNPWEDISPASDNKDQRIKLAELTKCRAREAERDTKVSKG